MLTLQEIIDCINKGEGQHIEFKREFPQQAHDFAKELCAFTNSGGGILIMGVDDNGNITGVENHERTVERISSLCRTLNEPINPFIDTITITKNLTLIYIVVEHKPIKQYQGKIYIRVGSTCQIANTHEIIELVKSDQNNNFNRKFINNAENRIRIASVTDVIDWGWDGNRLLEKLIELDYQTISGLDPDNEGHTEQWSPVFMDHPDSWRLLVDHHNDIVGYWHFVPLFENYYNQAKEGKLLDSEITSEKLCYLEMPGIYKIYFVSISIMPKYRNAMSFNLLINSFIDRLDDLAKKGIYFHEMIANAFTPQGISLCKTLEMNFICDHADYGKIYWLNLIPLPNIRLIQKYPDLLSNYREVTS
jgi:hypothetical protein